MRRARRAGTLASLALAVLGLHATLWLVAREVSFASASGARNTPPTPAAAGTGPAMSFDVRHLPIAQAAVAGGPPAAPRDTGAWVPSGRPDPARVPAAASVRAAPGPAVPTATVTLPAKPDAAAAAVEMAAFDRGAVGLGAGDLRAADPSAPAAVAAPPVYATRLPPPGRWRYRMQRGAVEGEAELRFDVAAAVDGDPGPAYALRLTALVHGAPPVDWASRGHLDAAGLAPERFALRRKGRDRQAANFQREAGLITFSGPTHAHALPAGAQDRLSWVVQLGAIVGAAPERFVEGSRIDVYVAGARGDAQIWRFTVEGEVDGPPGPSGAGRLLKLVREPERLYDTRAEVWLDPSRQFLPQRLRQTPQGGGPGLDLTYDGDVI